MPGQHGHIVRDHIGARIARRIRRYTPTVVWIAAVALAFRLDGEHRVVGPIVGYMRDQPVKLAHLEPGIVRNVHVRLHELVEPGQILVSMDDRQERIALAAIQKDIERLTADVEARRAQIVAANGQAVMESRDLERRFLADRENAHVDYLARILDHAVARAQLRGSQIEFEIVERLYKANHVQFREFNLARTDVESLRARVQTTEAVSERAKAAFTDADRRWVQFSERDSNQVSYDPVLTPLRLAADVRERELNALVNRIDAHVLRSPIHGQVTTLTAHAGDHMLAGTTLVAVSPTESHEAVAFLSERAIHDAALGAPIMVLRTATVAGKNQEYKGTISSLSSTITEAPRRFRLFPTTPIWGREMIVTLNKDAALLPGEAVSLRFLPLP